MWQRLYCSSTVWVLYYLYWKLYFNMTDGSIRVIPPNELLRVHPPKIENFIIFWPNNLDILFSKRWKLCFFGSKFLKWSNLIFFDPVLNQNCQNSMKFLFFTLLQYCCRKISRLNNFEMNGYLFFYFCLKKKYKIIFIKIVYFNYF